MKVIIAGSRTLRSFGVVRRAIYHGCAALQIAKPSEVVSGGASGVDSTGELWAGANGVPVRRFPADWIRYGLGAGPIRNREMADYADALIAVWDGKSRGTADMIRQMRERGKPVEVFTPDDVRVWNGEERRRAV